MTGLNCRFRKVDDDEFLINIVIVPTGYEDVRFMREEETTTIEEFPEGGADAFLAFDAGIPGMRPPSVAVVFMGADAWQILVAADGDQETAWAIAEDVFREIV